VLGASERGPGRRLRHEAPPRFSKAARNEAQQRKDPTMTIELTTTSAAGTATAKILPQRGGLLTSLRLCCDGEASELLWMTPDLIETESGWPGGGMPIMFPFAGRVFAEGQPFRYDLKGKTYNMPLHGFAYALPWELSRQSASEAVLRLVSNAGTETLYPFAFNVTAHYRLEAARLNLTLGVENLSPDGAEMPVALGLHPYFRMPFAGGDKARCRLATTARTKIAVSNAGGAGKATPLLDATLVAPDGRLPLTTPLLGNLILGDHQRPDASLVDEAADRAIRVGWDHPALVPYVVLWTREGESFHCLEPWMGLPDAVSTGAGGRWLKAGESLQLGFSVTLERAPA
jgi:galactose mutarotase-like enzyme